MVFLLNLGVGIGQLIVTLWGGFGIGGDIFSGIVLAEGRECLFDEGVVKVVGFEGEMVVKAEVELEEVAVFVSERMACLRLFSAYFFWRPLPHCPFWDGVSPERAKLGEYV